MPLLTTHEATRGEPRITRNPFRFPFPATRFGERGERCSNSGCYMPREALTFSHVHTSRRMSRRKSASSNAPRASLPAAAPVPAPAAALPQPAARNTARNLSLITLIIGGPYAIYLAYMWLHLQSGLIRPPVATNGARQLLVVGTQSSGTTGTTEALQRLGLEVAK